MKHSCNTHWTHKGNTTWHTNCTQQTCTTNIDNTMCNNNWTSNIATVQPNTNIRYPNHRNCVRACVTLFSVHVTICLQEHSMIVTKMLDFVGHLSCNRAFSASVYDAPPFAYSALFSPHVDDKQRAVTAMQRDCKLLHELEALNSNCWWTNYRICLSLVVVAPCAYCRKHLFPAG